MKRVSVFGLGYVGAVTAACLAHKGHRVIGVDVNPGKVEVLESGQAPVLEPGLDQLVSEAHKAGRLHATTDLFRAVDQSEICQCRFVIVIGGGRGLMCQAIGTGNTTARLTGGAGLVGCRIQGRQRTLEPSQ